MNQQQWQMKKDQAASVSVAAVRASGRLVLRSGRRSDDPELEEPGAATPFQKPHQQTCFDWGARAEQPPGKNGGVNEAQ